MRFVTTIHNTLFWPVNFRINAISSSYKFRIVFFAKSSSFMYLFTIFNTTCSFQLDLSSSSLLYHTKPSILYETVIVVTISLSQGFKIFYTIINCRPINFSNFPNILIIFFFSYFTIGLLRVYLVSHWQE